MDSFDSSTFDFQDIDYAIETDYHLGIRESELNVSRSIVPVEPLVVCEPPVILRPSFKNGKCIGHEKIIFKLKKPSEADFAPMRQRYLDEYKAETIRLNYEIYSDSLTAKERYRRSRTSVTSSPRVKTLTSRVNVEEPKLSEITPIDVSDVRLPSTLLHDGLWSRAERLMCNRPLLENPSDEIRVTIMNTTTSSYSLMNSVLDGVIPSDWKKYVAPYKVKSRKGLSLTSDFKSIALPLIRLFLPKKRNRRSVRPLTIAGRSLFREEKYFPARPFRDVFPFGETPTCKDTEGQKMCLKSGTFKIWKIDVLSAEKSLEYLRMKIPLRSMMFLSQSFCNGLLTQLQKWVLHIPW